MLRSKAKVHPPLKTPLGRRPAPSTLSRPTLPCSSPASLRFVKKLVMAMVAEENHHHYHFPTFSLPESRPQGNTYYFTHQLCFNISQYLHSRYGDAGSWVSWLIERLTVTSPLMLPNSHSHADVELLFSIFKSRFVISASDLGC